MSVIVVDVEVYWESALRKAARKLMARKPGAAVTLEEDELQALIDDVARHPEQYQGARFAGSSGPTPDEVRRKMGGAP